MLVKTKVYKVIYNVKAPAKGFQPYKNLQYIFIVPDYDLEEKLEFIDEQLYRHHQIIVDTCYAETSVAEPFTSNSAIKETIKSML